MKNQKGYRFWVGFFLVLVLVSGVFSGCTTSSEDQGKTSQTPEESTTATEVLGATQTDEQTPGQALDLIVAHSNDEKNQSYLATYFDINLSGKTLDADLINESMRKVAGSEVMIIEGELTPLLIINAAVTAADYLELASSYSAEKVTQRLNQYGITSEVDSSEGKYLVAALDTALIKPGEAQKAIAGIMPNESEMTNLLMAIATVNGDARSFLGYSNDPEVAARLNQMWDSFIIYHDEELTDLGKTAVQQGITTGYNLKTSAYDARFLPELTLQYGHDSIKHAHQLLALLNSENIVAKVQLEPKVSVYQYLLEWGPIPEATPTYEVKQFGDDLYLVFAVEYDLMLEFDSESELLAFDGIIETYAKKYEGNEEAMRLIASSWWQPLYSTTNEQLPAEDYHLIYDCVVSNGIYSIHPFTLPENLDQVLAQLKEIAPDQEINPVARYCNTAFFNYLNGDDYQ